MDTADEVVIYFQELNINISEEVLKKCVDICSNFNVAPEEFVDQWIASTLSKKWDSIPTLDNLEKFKRTNYLKNKKEQPVTPKVKRTSNNDDIDSTNKRADSNYTTPKKLITKESLTSETESFRSTEKDTSLIDSPLSSSYSQAGTYNDRTDSRSVQCSYGPTVDHKNQSGAQFPVRLHIRENPSGFRYMYAVLSTIAEVMNYLTNWIASCIVKNELKSANDLDLFTSSSNMGQVTTYGRISSDDGGRLNVQSVILEETMQLSHGHTTKLRLNKLKDYSLFPGQIVVVQGNSTTSGLIVDKIYSNASLQLPKEIPSIENNLEIVVAAGPFSLRDNIKFEPLRDLIEYVIEYKPHVLILMGPFVEATPETALICEQDFTSFFEGELMEGLQKTFYNLDTKIVIISSHKEAHVHNIFPTPAYKENKLNIMFMPDPCTINIGGLVISATNTDVLFHLGKEELYRSTDVNPDRMTRLSSYILQQQNFYPLHPAHENLSIDYNVFEQYGFMNCSPHILILPSTLRCFAKEVNNCLVVNPERLTKGVVGGTFGRIHVKAGPIENIFSRVSCEILRI